jgi:hypothetical protein
VSYYALSGPDGTDESECTEHPGPDFCLGYERSCPDADACCPPATWYNWVYSDVIGMAALRAQNEKKVRAIAQMLVVPDQYGENGIERLAYDKGRCGTDECAPALFVQAAKLAFASFDACFPEQRFSWDPTNAKSDDCGEYGGFDEDYRYWSKSRFDAVSRAADTDISPTFQTLVLERGLAPYSDQFRWRTSTGDQRVFAGARLGAFLDEVAAIVKGVPGGQPGQYIDSKPRMEDLVYVADNGYVAPTPWLQHFIAALIPKRQAAGAGPTATAFVKSPWAARPKGVWAQIEPGQGESRKPPAATSNVVIAGASVVALGLGYLLARRLS